MRSVVRRLLSCRWSSPVTGALLLCALHADLSAQSVDDVLAAAEIGRIIGDRVGSAMQSAGTMANEAGRASATIQTLRERYWSAVASGQGVDAARQEFESALIAKDFHYLILAIPEGTDGPRAAIINLLSGGVDGGIHPSARPQFERWVGEIRVALGAEDRFDRSGSSQRMVIPGPARLAEAFEAAREQQEFYIRARDWAELDASGLSFPWDRDARAFALMLLHRHGPLRSSEEVASIYGELVDLFGEEHVLAAADRIRTAPRTPEGLLANPQALGVDSRERDAAFAEILARRSGDTFLSYLAWQGSDGPGTAHRIVNRWKLAYGFVAVAAAAEEIVAGIGDERYRIAPLGRLYWDIIDELQATSLEGYLRAVIAHGEEVDTPEALDAAYRRLLERYGERRTLEAAARLRWALHRQTNRSADLGRSGDYGRLLEILNSDVDPDLAAIPAACGAGTIPTARIDDFMATSRSRVHTPPRLAVDSAALLQRLRYPDADRQAGRQGDVRLQGLVGLDGRVVQASAIDSSGATATMVEAARELLLGAEYAPATVGSDPVCGVILLDVPFRLSAAELADGLRAGGAAPAADLPSGYARVDPIAPADAPRSSSAVVGARDGFVYWFSQSQIFRIGRDGGFHASVHDFWESGALADRRELHSAVLNSDGELVGSLRDWRDNGHHVFKVGADGEGYAVIHSFDPGVRNPRVLAAHPDGGVYGIVGLVGGRTAGVFTVSSAGEFRVVHAFETRDYVNVVDNSHLVVSDDGTVHLLVVSEAAARLIRVPAGGTGQASVTHTFQGPASNGYLALAGDGSVFGTIAHYRDRTNWHIFRVDRDGGYAEVHRFENHSAFSTLTRVIVEGADGLLYGLADAYDGRDVENFVYRVQPDGTGFARLDAEPFSSTNGLAWADGALVGIGEPAARDQRNAVVFRYVPARD